MDLRHFRYFCAVARERNFSRAALSLHIAQPPLSRAMLQLEDELGVALFDRTTRPLNLTEAGRFFFEQASQILMRVEQIHDSTKRIGKAQRRTCVVGCVGSTLYGEVPDFVRRLGEKRPDLDVEICEIMSAEQASALKEGRIDLGFGRVRFIDPDVACVTLREERLVVAMPLRHAKATTKAPLCLADLSGESMIFYPSRPRPSFADEILNLLAKHDVRPGDMHEVREIQTALGMVAAGAGLCLIPAASQRLRPDDLVYRLIEDVGATSPVLLSYRQDDTSGIAQTAISLTEEIYAEHPAWLQFSAIQI